MGYATGIYSIPPKQKSYSKVSKLLGRDDVELEELEITGGSTRYHPVVCGVIVDATSAEGMVVVAARGYPVRQVVTGKTIAGDCSVEMAIQEGEVCHIYGGSTVLFYKPFIKACTRTAEPELTVHRKSTKGPPTLQLPSLQLPPLESPGVLLPSFRDLINGVPPSSPPGVPVITVRLQKDSEGRFGKSHDMSCFQARTKAVEFFAWFGRQTGRGGAQGPPVLFVSLPNAIPHAKSVKVVRDIEEDFKYARRRILVHYEKTKLLSTSLREFAVLITEPGWGSK